MVGCEAPKVKKISSHFKLRNCIVTCEYISTVNWIRASSPSGFLLDSNQSMLKATRSILASPNDHKLFSATQLPSAG